jgi:glucose/arabinose dehydrogenase
MSTIDLVIFLTSYLLVVAFVALAEWLRSRRLTALVLVVVALAVLSTTTVVGSWPKPEGGYLGLLWFLVQERDFSAVVALGLGGASALAWLAWLNGRLDFSPDDRRNRLIRQTISYSLFVVSVLGVALAAYAFIWKDLRGIQLDPLVRVHEPGFVVEKIADLENPPIRVAVGDGQKVYVCYDYFGDAGTMGGGIVELAADPATGKYSQRVAADSPLLMRCYGLAVRDGELFVSRSGICARASEGRIRYDEAGAVTRLSDMDGDGYFEFADDVVTGLPGARGPVTMHQNNGLCVGSDGALFVTVASAADRSIADHPWEGTILRVSPDLASTRVFAEGFRNPFGVTVGPDGELFATDNDVDANPGDELNHIVEGSHYGHPYVVPGEVADAGGFRDPVLVGEHEMNFLGLAYATATALPDNCRDCLYVADFMQNAVWRMRLEKSGSSYRVVSVDRFVTISSPIDIAVSPAGEFFVVSRVTRNVYRIRPRQAGTGGSHGS